MKPYPTLLALLFACLLPAPTVSAATNTPVPAWTDITFKESAPYASAVEITRHLGYKVPLPPYDITKEKFQIIIPKTYSTNSDWGLLVWISPSDPARIPSEWESEMAQRELLFISARNAGNDRDALDRFRIALDATFNMCRRYKIARKRIYIGGFSGGSRVASILGVAYGDIYTGTLCVCGVNFYKTVRDAKGAYYTSTYTPDAGILSLAKKSGRFVLLTGEQDMNRENTSVEMEHGFKPAGFSHLLYLEVPGMKHALPGPADLKTALDFLDQTPAALDGKRAELF